MNDSEFFSMEQGSEIRSQPPAHRGLRPGGRSEVINSSSLTGLDQKWSRVLKHVAQHRTNALTFCGQAAMVFIGDVSTIFCKVEPSICLAVFSI